MVRCLIVASGRRISVSSGSSLAFTVPIVTASTEALGLSDGVKKCQGSETTKISLHYSLPGPSVPGFRVYASRTVFAIAIARSPPGDTEAQRPRRSRKPHSICIWVGFSNSSTQCVIVGIINLSGHPHEFRVQGLVLTCHCTEMP